METHVKYLNVTSAAPNNFRLSAFHFLEVPLVRLHTAYLQPFSLLSVSFPFVSLNFPPYKMQSRMKAIEELALLSQFAVYGTQPKPQDLKSVLFQLLEGTQSSCQLGYDENDY